MPRSLAPKKLPGSIPRITGSADWNISMFLSMYTATLIIERGSMTISAVECARSEFSAQSLLSTTTVRIPPPAPNRPFAMPVPTAARIIGSVNLLRFCCIHLYCTKNIELYSNNLMQTDGDCVILHKAKYFGSRHEL